ncbi:hypothetical protein V5799_024174 [Amblyomma americanum]|uniref:Uncharacterized protein n=1 Tax=Amblyomma americanum TaxID=6943 RepID=A0AAQ4ED76_AMBAM
MQTGRRCNCFLQFRLQPRRQKKIVQKSAEFCRIQRQCQVSTLTGVESGRPVMERCLVFLLNPIRLQGIQRWRVLVPSVYATSARVVVQMR